MVEYFARHKHSRDHSHTQCHVAAVSARLLVLLAALPCMVFTLFWLCHNHKR
jgi:hypothetical protein